MGNWYVSQGILSEAKAFGAACGSATSALFCGGITGAAVTTTEIYNGTTWAAGGNLSIARLQLALFGNTSAANCCGGTTDTVNSLSSSEIYNGTTWAAGGNLPSTRRLHAGHGTQSAGLVSGGYQTSPNANLKSTLNYNGSTFIASGDMPTARLYHGGAGTQASALVFSGASSGGGNEDGITYVWNNTVWAAGGNCITSRLYCGGGGLSNNAAIKFGGEILAGSVKQQDSETYNGTVWTSQGNLPAIRSALPPGSIGSSLQTIAIAGNTSSGYTATSFSYQIFNLASSGGAVFGGNALIGKLLNYSSSGGFVAGGASVFHVGFYRVTMSGGFIAGGITPYHIGTYRAMMSGGFIAGGTSPNVFSSIFAQDVTWGIWDNNNNPVLGASANTSIKVRRVADNALMDWSNLTFKTSGWTQITNTLQELDAVNLQGYYHLSLYVTQWVDGWYQVFLSYNGTPKQNGDIEMYLKGGIVQEIRSGQYVDMAISGRASQTSVNAIPTNPALATDYTAARASKIDNLDAAVSSRFATAGYTAPDNTSITAIKAKTDNLPLDPASNTQVSTRLATTSYTAPDNTSITAIKAKTDNLPLDPASNTQVSTRLATTGYTAPDNTSITAILTIVTLLNKYVRNKKEIKKIGTVKHLYIYDTDGVTILIDKTLKDSFGNDISDLIYGVLALESSSIV